MSGHSDRNDPTIEEAGRILIEAHADLLAPKVSALTDAVATLADSSLRSSCLPAPALRLLILPENTEHFLQFGTSADQAPEIQRTDFEPALSALQTAWAERESFSAYLLPDLESQTPFSFALALRMGGWESNQPFRGLLLLLWLGPPAETFPFETPGPPERIAGASPFRFLPLPPGFERSAKKDEWIAFPARIKQSREWTEVEAAVSVISEVGAKILDRVVPVLADAAWKSMARRVMHELSRTVAMPQPMLEEARKALNSALSSVRRARLPAEGKLEAKLIRHLKTIDDNLAELESDQSYVLSKVRWFFYLVAEELRADAPELAGLDEILQQSIESLGCNIETDAVLEDSEKPLWRARFKLPRLFPQHSLEAFISNSFLRRDPGEAVRFTVAENGTQGYTLCWTNRAATTDAQLLAAELEKPAPARSFGLRMAESISATFFGSPLEISVKTDSRGPLVLHQLRIPATMLEIPATTETNVSSL